MASKTAQLNNEAVSLINLEKNQEALALLNKALLRRISQRSSFRSLSLFDTSGEQDVRVEIFNNSQAQFEFNGECDEGMRTFSSILEIYLDDDDDCDDEDPVDQIIVDAVIYFNQGIVLTRLDQDDEAFPYFQKSLSLKHSYSSYVHKTKFGFFEIATLHNLAHINYRNGEYEESLSKYRMALQLAEEFFERNHVDTALSLNCIGVVIMQMTRGSDDGTEESLFHFCEALIIIHNVDEEEHHSELGKIAATIMNNIGRVRVLRGEIEEALSMYEKAMRIRKSLFGEEHLNTVAINFNMAEAFHLGGHTDEALEMLHKFLSVASSHLGDDHIAVLNILADGYVECDELEKAADLYRMALMKLQSASPVDQEEVAQMMNALGNILYEIGDSESALEVYKDGLDIEREIYDPGDAKIVVTVLNIARIYHHEKDFHRALETYREGIQLQRQAEETHPLDLASTLESIGSVTSTLGLLDESKDAYQEALLIKEEEFDGDHFDTSVTLNSIGLVLFNQKLYDDALSYFEDSLSIRYQVCSETDSSIAPVLFNIATVHLETGNFDGAFESFQECLSIERYNFNEDNTEMVSTLKRIGQMYEKKDISKFALFYYKETVKLYLQDCTMNPSDYHEVSTIYRTMGHILLNENNVDGAAIMFTNASRAMQFAGDESSAIE